MLRSYLFSAFLLISVNYTYSQNNIDSIMFAHWNRYFSGGDYLVIQGRNTVDYPELQKIFDNWRVQNPLMVKFEDEIDSNDVNKHLEFYGPIASFKYINKYLPNALSISANSFKLGHKTYCDSLDAIRIISHSDKRMFLLSNSYIGLKSLWTTFQELSQYFIMQNWAITSHGFLLNDNFNSATHYNTDSLHKKELIYHTTKYYNFHYAPEVFSKGQNIDSMLDNEDQKIKNVLNFFNLTEPKRKIDCYMYRDMEQKYFHSATPGFGNPFPKAFQNHSIGLGPVEHESIHILFENLVGPCSTFLSEGVVGYYYASIDSNEWKGKRGVVTSHLGFDVKTYFTNQGAFSFSSLDYAGSAFFTKYLIDTYGLPLFYDFVKAGFDTAALKSIYGKGLDNICNEWNSYFQANKTKLGENKKITFRIKTTNVPDSSKIFIVGDNKLLGNWNPGLIELIKLDDNTWSKEFQLPEGTILNYKITRGSWQNEALNSNGKIPGNTIYEVKQDDLIEIQINRWRDGVTGK